MTENNPIEITHDDEDSIDIIALLKTVWGGRKLIVMSIVVFFVIGCIVALSSPIVYTSETTFVPQTSDDQMSTPKGLGSLAGLVGINLNSVSSSNDAYLSPLLYSKIADSEEFSINLLNEQLINLEGDSLSVKENLSKNIGGFSLIGFIKKYTIGLFSIENPEPTPLNPALDPYNFVSAENFKMIKILRKKFSIELNDKEGYIKVIANDENAFISSQLVSLVTKNLQSRIIDLRTKKIKERLDYSKEQYDLKRTEFENLQNKVARFKDSNKNISTAMFLSRLEKLQSEYTLQQSILMTLANEYNQNKIKLNKDTPIFSVIDEVFVPNERSEPKRSLIVIVWVFLGFVLVVGYLLAKAPFMTLLSELKTDV
jgi:uncharacterized protein involved in exopolysaccharide biosynthesis